MAAYRNNILFNVKMRKTCNEAESGHLRRL